MAEPFRVLGRIELRVAGAPVALGPPKQRTTLALLLLRLNRPTTVPALVDEVWPEGPPRSAVANMTSYLSQVRRIASLAGAGLERGGGQYTLRASPFVWDLGRFADLAAGGDAAFAAGDRPGALDGWGSALDLWCGEPFAAVPLGPQLTAARLEWTERHHTLLERHAATAVLAGRARGVLADLRRHTASVPLRETGWLVLVAALYLDARPAEAIGAYEQMRAALRDELGVDPGTPLRDLQTAVLRADRPAVRAAVEQIAGVSGPEPLARGLAVVAGRPGADPWRFADPAAQVRIHRGLAAAYSELGEYQEAAQHLRSALDGLDRLGDRSGQGEVHLEFALVRERRGDPQQALRHAEQALALFQRAEDRRGQARALNSIGWSEVQVGRPAEARTHCLRAVSLGRRLADPVAEAAALDSLALACSHLGEHRAATRHYAEAVALFRTLDSVPHRAHGLRNAGDHLHRTGRHSAARTAWAEALELLEAAGHPATTSLHARLS